MIQNIARGYSKLLGSAAKVVALLVLCTLLGAAIVYPLWKFATELPAVYTGTVLAVMVAGLALLAIKRIKARGFFSVLNSFLRVAVIVGGAVACVALVLHGKRLFALPVIAAVIVLYGVLSFGRN